MLTSFYNQFVNFIQEMHTALFVTIWVILLAGVLICLVRFFKIYDGTQKKFEKISLMIIALILFALLIYITYIRK